MERQMDKMCGLLEMEAQLLTRSIRRVNRPWTGFLSYYQNFETASWEYQTNFGGRIIPTKRAGIPLRTGSSFGVGVLTRTRRPKR